MADDPIQMGFRYSDFAPVARGPGHYVAVVQNKPGELEALRQASPETWARLTPLVEIVGRRKRPLTYKSQTIRGWVSKVAAAVGANPCFLDILRLRPDHPSTGPEGDMPLLAAVYAAARSNGMTFVPTVPVGAEADPVRAKLARDANAQDGRGVALRYAILNVAFETGASHASLLRSTLEGLEVDASSADILIDLRYLSGDEELHPDDIGEAIDEVLAAGLWRSIVLLGTSMPSMLGGIIVEGTIGELPRREWDLWSALKSQNLSRLPTFGDYVVQHPDPPSDEDGGGPSMRANVRYTTNTRTLIARAKGPVVREGREQYRELCQQLVERPEFAGENYSWGDRQITACASGTIEPGWQNLWRGAASSHHFRVVTQQVSS